MKHLLYILFLSLMGCRAYIPIEENKEYIKRREIAENAISDWIKKYAKYPNSYESISFSDYEESFSSNGKEKIPNSENFKIQHTHRILTKDSVIETFSGYFIMEYDYFVSIIEIEKSNSLGGAFPPMTEIWMHKFGRNFNKQDSLEIEERREMQTHKVLNELKDAIDNGHVESDNPKDAELLKSIIDSTLNK